MGNYLKELSKKMSRTSIGGTSLALHEIAQFILKLMKQVIISSPVTALANYNFDLIDIIIAYHGLLMVHFFDGTSLH